MSDTLSGSAVSGSLASSTQSSTFQTEGPGLVSVALSGTWVGTAKVQRSYDRGTTWRDMTVGGSTWASFTANCDEPVDEAARAGIQYRIDFTRTSGTLVYSLGNL